MGPPVQIPAAPTFAGRIGVARRDITPPPGIFSRNWGAAKDDVAAGLHRPLTATVLAVFGEGEAQPLVLAALDLGWIKSAADELALRTPILERLGLDAARLMISLSHTHAGPSISASDADQPGGHLIRPYVEELVRTIADAAREAMTRAEPATLAWRYGRCDLAADRDLPDPSDPSRYLVGYHPDASADDTLLVGRVCRDPAGSPLATIVNYACHPTTLAWDNRLISPDYVGGLRDVVEPATGGAPCLFLQGASGDLAPAEQYSGDAAVADGHGHRLGHAVLATLCGMMPPRTTLHFGGVVKSGAELARWTRGAAPTVGVVSALRLEVPLPLKPRPRVEEIQRQLAACEDRALQERLRRRLHQVRSLGEGPTYAADLWAWRIGGALLFGQPNEAYSLWQSTLRQAWPGTPVAAMNVVNGSVGYLVAADRCHDGLYAFWQSPFERDAFTTLLNASLKTGAQLLGDEPACRPRPTCRSPFLRETELSP